MLACLLAGSAGQATAKDLVGVFEDALQETALTAGAASTTVEATGSHVPFTRESKVVYSWTPLVGNPLTAIEVPVNWPEL